MMSCRTLWMGLLAGGMAAHAWGGETNGAPAPAPSVADPYEGLYREYNPDYGQVKGVVGWDRFGEGNMKLSSEKSFFTLTMLPESDRAYALLAAAKEKEKERQYNRALEIYQKLIDEYPDPLYRVSEHGIFVPMVHYCQLRILAFPREALQHYRVKFDGRAKESFEIATQKNSLEGLADVRDKMLATSYGAGALITLGYSALDRGHYLEALEYFETVWRYFPGTRSQNPDLALSIALCRKMLGSGANGADQKPAGHWKLDDGSGNTAADASGNGSRGTLNGTPAWVPGKAGGSLRFDKTNSVSIPGSKFLDVGMLGADFSVAFWVWLDEEWENDLFAKRGRDPGEMLQISTRGKNYVVYSIVTQDPKLETGGTKGAVGTKRWAHVAFVKSGGEVRIYLDGKLDLRETLRGVGKKNTAGITLGPKMRGCLDDVRLYQRALADREVAELAGSVGTAAMTADPASGEAPLTVEFAVAEADKAKECRWEFGDGESATGPKVKHTYGIGGKHTAVVSVVDASGAIAVARATISVSWRAKDADFAKRMTAILGEAKYDSQILATQPASPGGVSADDYLLMPPTRDPLGLGVPVWVSDLTGTLMDAHVYTQPVVTRQSVIFRHKNILYCYSILSGELRWKNDLGGRVAWQNWEERQYPLEDVLVQDGMVFTPIFKVGPTLTALDEVTGQVKWAYGPMMASTPEVARMRFETAPAGGPRAVYAGYILDNIEGQTHTDSEYGVIAFESVTGRVLWRREICRLRPGKFTAGFAVKRRNLIRSFLSPPLYKEGTLYYCTNAGAMAALDALSGQIKWVMLYPYYLSPESVHDATRQFGGGGGLSDHFWAFPHSPMFWYNQRPLMIEDALYVVPVDSPFLYRIDRRTGKVEWMKRKGYGRDPYWNAGGPSYFLGPMSNGNLVIAYTGRQNVITTLDPQTGRTLWESGDVYEPKTQPVLKYALGGDNYTEIFAFGANGWPYQTAARPFLSSDDRVVVSGYIYSGCPIYGWAASLGVVDLNARKVTDYRNYMSGEFLRYCEWAIQNAPARRKRFEDIPFKDDYVKRVIEWLTEIGNDTVPVNAHKMFLPFSRVTFERFGVPFEVRLDARRVEMLYDREAAKAAVRNRRDPDGMFAQAELAVGEGRLTEAARLLQQCLRIVSPEDTDFRAMVNQQLYPVYKELARSGVRSGKLDAELANCVGMSQTVGTLTDEMESLLVLGEAYERKGDWKTAAKLAQSLVSHFGQYEHMVSPLLQGDVKDQQTACENVVGQVETQTRNHLYGKELNGAAGLMKKGVAAYFESALSPLRKDLKVRAGELGANRLMKLQRRFPELKQALDKEMEANLAGRPADEQVMRLWEYPGTAAAQKLVEQLTEATEKELEKGGASLESVAALRKRQWALADAARICGLRIPESAQERMLAPRTPGPATPVGGGMQNRMASLEEERGTAWLVMDREDSGRVEPDRLFLGGRVRKRLDNKFLLDCFDLKEGKTAWKAQEPRGEQWFDEIRLAGKGDEPGFSEAFVYRDIVVVHGLYDVLAFNLKDGKLKWRYQVPFAFEIEHAKMSGDLLALAGASETVVLCLDTADPRGEVVWQEKEEGNVYSPPYFHGDRLISVRKMPFNLTVRYRATGKLIGRLELPDLLLLEDNPLIEKGSKSLPVAWDGGRIVVTDGWYYILLDAERMKVAWKRLIEANDPTRLPPIRFELDGEYLAVVKQDFDVKAICMLSSETGEMLWRTDPKVPGSPQPIDSMLIRDGKLYGIKPHAGQGFFFVGMDCKTGKMLFGANEQTGYAGKPDVGLRHNLYGDAVVAQVRDRQDFELKVFSTTNGKLLHKMQVKAAGDFGEHGRASATVQNGKVALLGKNDLVTAGR